MKIIRKTNKIVLYNVGRSVFGRRGHGNEQTNHFNRIREDGHLNLPFTSSLPPPSFLFFIPIVSY